MSIANIEPTKATLTRVLSVSRRKLVGLRIHRPSQRVSVHIIQRGKE